MTSSASSSLIDEQSALPAARIDAQEEEYAGPLREYLETNGCRVFVNKPALTGVAYAIASGDFDFVKDIFSKPAPAGVRRLGIVFNSSLTDAKKIANRDTKIAVVDPVHLMPNDVVGLFSFFFAENENTTDKRRTVHEPIAPQTSLPDAIEREVRPQSSTDSSRVSSIVSDVYSAEIKKQSSNPRRKKVKKSFGVILMFLFLIFVFPGIWYGASIGAAVASFAAGVSRLKRDDLSGAGRFDAIGTYWLYQGRLSLGLVSVPLRLAGLTRTVRGQERLLSFLSDASAALTETRSVSASARDTARQLLTSSSSPGETAPASSLEHIRISVETIMESAGLAQAELATLIRDKTFPFFIPPVAGWANSGAVTLASVRGSLAYIDNLLTLYPQVAGFRGQKTYLVLLQNSNELRTTGGFIGSVGLAKFDSGALSDFAIQDVYSVDGQLRGHVDPPVPIRELLAQEHWYLRDSNWDPDFKVSGARAAWFYEKETGITVDGVIAVNVPVVVDLLKVTGPLFLPDYNDRISADNFFGKSLYYTQNNTFAGSTQKSDFLGTLSRAVLTDVTTAPGANPINVFRAVAAGLARRDILFTFTDSDAQQLVEHFGWAGRVFDRNGCTAEAVRSCVFDPFGAFEENVSVNKVNYFIQRTTKRDITLSPDGKISETFTLNLRNTSDASPAAAALGVGGAYTSYVRFFMIPDAEVGMVTLDGIPVPPRNPKSKTPPAIPYFESATLSRGSKGIGVAVTVLPGEQHAIAVTMTHAAPIPFDRGAATLNFVYYKHPGVSGEVNQTIIQYPLSWKVENQGSAGGSADSLIAKAGQLTYNSTILQDQNIRLIITQ